MSKITNDSLTRSGTCSLRMLYSCTRMATVGVKVLTTYCTAYSVRIVKY